MSTTQLSKTNYLAYLACPQEFWMAQNQPELMPPFSLDAQHKVEQGNSIDRLAQDWFKDSPIINEKQINPDQVKFQYKVSSGHFLAKADITVFHGEKECDIYEVKAASGLKTEHLKDIAFQRMVFEMAGYKVRDTFLIHVNSKYTFQQPPDLNQFLQVLNVTEEVNKLKEETRLFSNQAFAWTRKEALPKLKNITTSCANGLNCSYIKHYHKPVPNYTIFDVSRLNKKKRETLLEMGVLDINDVPVDFKLSAKQREQVDIAQQNKISINATAIKEILDGLAYPLYFLDYETFSYVLPAQVGLTAYQQMVFQYSLHVIESKGAKPQHYEYLMPSKETPLEEPFKQMKSQMHPTAGTVIVWNESFEKTQNKKMAEILSEYADFLQAVNNRTFDLMKIFSKGLYQHPQFKGSASIKKVLPVLCPELNYADLEIQNGNAAVINWHHMTDGRMTGDEAERTRGDLLKYCELDTWAMVRIWEELGEVVNFNGRKVGD